MSPAPRAGEKSVIPPCPRAGAGGWRRGGPWGSRGSRGLWHLRSSRALICIAPGPLSCSPIPVSLIPSYFCPSLCLSVCLSLFLLLSMSLFLTSVPLFCGLDFLCLQLCFFLFLSLLPPLLSGGPSGFTEPQGQSGVGRNLELGSQTTLCSPRLPDSPPQSG